VGESTAHNGSETTIPTYKRHLLCDERGEYPAELQSSEEREVVAAETARAGFRCWYRNPNRPSQDSLGIAYSDGDETKIIRPDFVFFAEQDGEIVADIIDPHGSHLADALPKLKGLASYAETHGPMYGRIEAVARAGGKLRVLDMTRVEVRAAVTATTSAEALFKSSTAGDYA